MIACVVGTVLAACSSGRATPAGPWWNGVKIADLRSTATAVPIAVTDNAFAPQIVRVAPGATVSWRNDGQVQHNVLKAIDSQNFGTQFGIDALVVNGTYQYTFTTPGVYRYYCSLHGNPDRGMVGMVLVGDVDVNGSAIRATP